MSENGGQQNDQPGGEQTARLVIERLHLVNFTAFKDIEMSFSSGINAIIGENGTGKSHVLKAMYVLIKHATPNSRFPVLELPNYFFASYKDEWHICHKGSKAGSITLATNQGSLESDFQDRGRIEGSDSGYMATSGGPISIITRSYNPVFVPAKEILSHAHGLRSAYDKRELSFEKQYIDIISNAGSGILRSPSQLQRNLLRSIEDVIHGQVDHEDEKYFINQSGFKLELTLAAEGWRKFALLWRLIANGSIEPGTVLLWDEPEANLNPSLMKKTVEIMLALQQMGVQIFFATHDYVMLKWLDLLGKPENHIRYHALYRDEDDVIQCESADTLAGIQRNSILDTFGELYNADMLRTMERMKHGDN